jgi:hypothetical protein
VEVTALPATLAGDTREGVDRVASSYTPCAPSTSERGAEVVYTLVAPGDGTLSATLDDVPGDSVDVDVHLLTAPLPDACVARANVALSHAVAAGVRYWIVVDTWFNGSVELAGPYVLTLGFVPTSSGACPEGMVEQGSACMDRYEAPNTPGGLPLVMYTFNQAEAWCAHRGKRLCFDDEWTQACAGPEGSRYVYGNTRMPGQCNDEETWRSYDQVLLNGWPASASAVEVERVEDLFTRASSVSATAATASQHVQWLYQAEPAGQNTGCANAAGVMDLTGNVEEWTRRRTPGGAEFHGNLKGRYWADTRTCQNNITTHGDGFRFYEIGFRCCRDR